jgi:hypothetical protein
MQQQAQKEADERAYKIAREQQAKAALQKAQDDQLRTIGNMGTGEQNALSNLMSALQRTAR